VSQLCTCTLYCSFFTNCSDVQNECRQVSSDRSRDARPTILTPIKNQTEDTRVREKGSAAWLLAGVRTTYVHKAPNQPLLFCGVKACSPRSVPTRRS